MTTLNNPIAGRALPALPPSVLTSEGVLVDVSGDRWIIPSLAYGIREFDFSVLENLSAELVALLKGGLLHHLQFKSFSHFQNLYSNFIWFYRATLGTRSDPIAQIEIEHVLAYRGKLNRTTEWKLSVVRVLLTGLAELGFGIASEEATNYLRDSTLRGNIKGTSVRTRDPNTGAFTDVELLNIQSSLNDAYAAGEIKLSDFATGWMLLSYGLRTIQIAALKECDLVTEDIDGVKRYELRIPRAKQRDTAYRGAFKSRYCSKQLGQLLEAVIAENKVKFADPGMDSTDRPMFWDEGPGHLPGLQHHMSSRAIAKRIQQVIEGLSGLKANTRRFRITLGQRSADNGVDKHTLAELLDHSDTQNVHVYYEASPEMALRLDKHLAMDMAPLAQAFAGVVVTTEGGGATGAGNASKIYDRSLANNVDASLGDCGQMSFCGLTLPFACYTCRHFKPWIDGPHEAFLEALVVDRERMIAEATDPKIYTIRDRTILAVAQVIQLCEGMREEKGA